jgi:hypothetical protein
MSRPSNLALLVLLLAVPLGSARAADRPPSGLTATFSLAGGGELGLEEGDEAGLAELELTAGWELVGVAIRPEIGLALGVAPEGHVGIRPGLRWSLAELPVAVRIAADASNARGDGMRWRWLLVGLAAELRFTSLLGLYAEVDTGAPLNRDAGVPLLVRAGASFRF